MTGLHRLLIAAAPALLLCGQASAQDRTAAPFGYDEASRIGADAVKAARARGKAITVVVVNREGRVLVAHRMDGVSFLNLEVAQAKAATSAATGAATLAIEKGVESGKTSLLSVPGILAIGGGIPVMRGGQIVGGVGVSGGTSEEDQAIAETALAN
jgi:glc operon protein GlcG